MPALDGRQPSVFSADDAFPITPNDSNELTVVVRALMIAFAGDIVVVTVTGQTRTLTVPAGLIPLRVKQVKATGTTATGISGLI